MNDYHGTQVFNDACTQISSTRIFIPNGICFNVSNFMCFSISPFGHTPRSARSDHNVKSIEDEIDEEIDEDLSVAEDLLKSDNSMVSIVGIVKKGW